MTTSDDFYTPEWLVRALYKEFNPKKVFLPFDTEDSWFVKVSPVPYYASSKDFFGIPDEKLIELRNEGYVVFSNPPFSKEKKIIQRLRRLDIPYFLIAHGLYWQGLIVPGDSVYYCGYILYDAPLWMRPTQRTVIVANDGKGVYKKASFVYTYTKPYRGKKNLEWSDTPQSLDLWDTHLYAIRDYTLDLTKYEFHGSRLVRKIEE